MPNFANRSYLDNLLSSPSSPDTVLEWLCKGFGRAVLHLQRHDPKPYMHVLEHACLKLLQHDAQLESSRVPYLMKVIEHSGDSEYLISAIISVYRNGYGDKRDRWQICGLMTQLAANGTRIAKQALFEIASSLGSLPTDGSYADAVDLLTADFDLAIIHLQDEYARIASDDEKLEWLHTFLDCIKYSDRAKFLTDQELVGRIVGDFDGSLVSSVFEKQQLDRIAKRNRPKRAIPTYDTMSQEIRNPSVNRGLMYYGHAKSMPKEDLLRLAEDFRNETDPLIIWRYIGAFIWVRCPIGFKRILKFLDTSTQRSSRQPGDKQVVAINALSQFRHRTIRNLAHQMADQNDIWGAAMLIERNLTKEELPFVERLTSPEFAMSENDRHHVALLMHHVVEEVKDPSVLPMILNVYETSPCSTCRGWMVDALIEHNKVPDWIRVEAEFDANLDVAKCLGVKSQISV